MRTKELKTGLTRRMLSGGAALLLGGLLLGGCSQDDDWTGGDDLTAATFTAGIQATRTTTGGDAWLTTDKVGIYMLTTGGSLATAANVLADNAEYNVSDASTGALSPAGSTIYYPQTGNVDFISYYPYGTVTSGEYSITVAGQTSADAQNALDVLYAKTGNVAKSSTAVGLTFGHVLSKVTLNVTLGEGLTSLTGNDITAAAFSGMPQTATLALQDGTLTAGAAVDFSALKAATANAPAAATFTALLVPQTGGTGRTAVFTVDGADYIWTIPDGETFTAGNHYTYPVTVKLSGVTVGAPTITTWTVDDTHPTGMAEKLDVVKIPAGTFLMGSSDGSASLTGSPGDPNYTAAEPNRQTNETQHSVTLTKDFYMSKYQITNAQYAAFLNAAGIGSNGQGSVTYYKDNFTTPVTENQTFVTTNSWGVTHDGSAWKAQTGYENHPIINVTWYGAYAYADWAGGSLPTEAQWEYACRGGYENLPFGIGTGYELNNTLANFYWPQSWSWDGNSATATIEATGSSYPGTTQTVGTYPYANGYGLYDMHGNVFEWCSDWYGAYGSGPDTDPVGPNTGSNRVLRGGAWINFARDCRSAYRLHAIPGNAPNNFGFRVAFVP